VGSHRAQGHSLRRSRDVSDPSPVRSTGSLETSPRRQAAARRAAAERLMAQAGTSASRRPAGRRTHPTEVLAPTTHPTEPLPAVSGWLEAVSAAPADLSAPLAPVVPLGERRARREAERLAAARTADGPLSPRRAARAARADQGRTPAKAGPGRSVRVAGTPRRGRVGASLPRVGVAAALGLATIVTPVAGDFGSSADAAPAAPAAATVERTVSRAATSLALAPVMSESFRVVPRSAAVAAAAPASLAASSTPLSAAELSAIRDQAEQASRNQERAVLPGCDGKSVDLGAANGRIDRDDLCELWSGEFLRADAAVALARLNVEFSSTFGRDLCITDGYRSYGEQVSVRSRKPRLAARPGTSQHGWALAVDVCKGEASARTDEYQWMRENAPDFGWDNPDWARSGGSGPFEPWHWEYVAGQG
jgi:hypothetical protein